MENSDTYQIDIISREEEQVLVLSPNYCFLDHKVGWVPKDWCFRTVVLEKTLESPLDGKELKPANSKGNQPWIFIGRTDAEAEAPILGYLNVKSWHIWKDPDARKDWRQKEKRKRCLDITGSMHMHLSKLWEIVEDIGTWCATVHGVTHGWTTTTTFCRYNRHCWIWWKFYFMKTVKSC